MEFHHDDQELTPETSLVLSEKQALLDLNATFTSPAHTNPAMAYLMSLGSKRSRQTMGSFLTIVAKMIGFSSLKNCQWGALRRHHIQAIIDMLSDANKAPATINTYLAALKGVALEAWAMKQMDTESYQHIRQVKSVRGSRLPKGRALTSSEIRALFRSCEKDNSSKGLRDAAILSVLLGCGLRRSEIVAINYEHIQFRDQAFLVRGKGNKER
ncbi:integrase, partial [Proteus mirabilis]